MAVTTTTATESLWPGRTLSEFVLDALRSLWMPDPGDAGGTAVERASDRLKNDPIYSQITELVQPAMDAQNVHLLRQVLSRIALSPAMVSLEITFSSSSEVKLGDAQGLPAVPPHASRRLGGDATALLVEAFRLFQPVLLEQISTGEFARQAGLLRAHGALEVAKKRHEVILGDLLPASVADLLLASFRGQVAFLALVASSLGDHRVPEWKAVALGEIAVEGMKALQRLALPSADCIDLETAAQEHAAWKNELFDRLEAEEASGAGMGTPTP